MARTSLEHSFLSGSSLWAQPDSFTAVNPACASQPLGADNPTPKCTAFLQANEKAAEQWQLEHRYQLFEASQPLGARVFGLSVLIRSRREGKT